MVILDLEFNSGLYGVSLEEILQIGAVKIDSFGGPVLDTFSVYIKPTVHKRLSPVAKVLPELSRSMDSAVTFREALEEFVNWCGEESDFAEWGRNDVRILKKNALYWGIQLELGERYMDLQSAFSKRLGINNSLPLATAVDYCGIPDSFVFHDALNDAMYTALVSGYIGERWIEQSLFTIGEKEKRPVIAPKLPKKNQTRSGPFDSRKQALSSRLSRRVMCPECGAVLCVNEWATRDGELFYARCSCHGHARFIRRLRLLEAPDGRFWTYTDTMNYSTDNIKILNDAKNHARHTCSSDKPGRRRRGN